MPLTMKFSVWPNSKCLLTELWSSSFQLWSQYEVDCEVNVLMAVLILNSTMGLYNVESLRNICCKCYSLQIKFLGLICHSFLKWISTFITNLSNSKKCCMHNLDSKLTKLWYLPTTCNHWLCFVFATFVCVYITYHLPNRLNQTGPKFQLQRGTQLVENAWNEKTLAKYLGTES